MQKQVWTKKFLQHFQSEQPHRLTTQRKLKELQAFGVCTPCDWPGLLMIPFEGQIGHGGRLDKALDLGAWGEYTTHITRPSLPPFEPLFCCYTNLSGCY